MMKMDTKELVISIDEDFKKLIPPISQEEYRQLEENILQDGCRDPLVCWNNIVLDGHNRLAICFIHNIPYKTIEMSFQSKEDAADWIDKNQLGRRNLSPDQMSLLRGRRYNRLKKSHGGQIPGSRIDQNDPSSTAESLAEQHGVSAPTIKRDGQFADAVETVKKIDPDIEQKVTWNQAPPKIAVIKAAELLEQHPEQAQAILNGVVKISSVVKEIKREETKSKLEDINTKQAKEIQGVFDVIVIDPPWKMKKIERDCRPNQSEFDYPTMTVDELTELKIPCAEDCHVWLWTTHKYLPHAFELLKKWELKYVCTFVWHKPGGYQPTGLPQYNCEFVLYARKGSPIFTDLKSLFVCFEAPRGKHSEKPEEFYELLRRVTAGRRLDMFNRRNIDGFETWGNEA